MKPDEVSLDLNSAAREGGPAFAVDASSERRDEADFFGLNFQSGSHPGCGRSRCWRGCYGGVEEEERAGRVGVGLIGMGLGIGISGNSFFLFF